jgi:hypothetical protein
MASVATIIGATDAIARAGKGKAAGSGYGTLEFIL